MKKNTAPMNYRKQIFLRYTLSGLFWIAAGILMLFDNPILSITSSLFGIAVAISFLCSIRSENREESDEMSEQNSAQAAEFSLAMVVCITALASCILGVLPDSFLDHLNWKVILRATLEIIPGLLFLIKGIVFAQLEDE